MYSLVCFRQRSRFSVDPLSFKLSLKTALMMNCYLFMMCLLPWMTMYSSSQIKGSLFEKILVSFVQAIIILEITTWSCVLVDYEQWSNSALVHANVIYLNLASWKAFFTWYYIAQIVDSHFLIIIVRSKCEARTGERYIRFLNSIFFKILLSLVAMKQLQMFIRNYFSMVVEETVRS